MRKKCRWGVPTSLALLQEGRYFESTAVSTRHHWKRNVMPELFYPASTFPGWIAGYCAALRGPAFAGMTILATKSCMSKALFSVCPKIELSLSFDKPRMSETANPAHAEPRRSTGASKKQGFSDRHYLSPGPFAAVAADNYATWLYCHPVYLNTTAAGANVSATTLKFPVLVRLNPGNFDGFANA